MTATITEIIGTSMEMLGGNNQRSSAPVQDPSSPPGHEGEDVPF